MGAKTEGTREGNLEAPTRHPLDWQSADFYDEEKLYAELERVYDICHGCRRCVSLCNSFPTLFDLVDESDTMEVDGVAKKDYWKVVEHCYLCDLCYMTKCPYVPPHEWNVDFPHLMLRAKAVKFKKSGASFRDKLLSSTDTVGKMASIPVIVNFVNTANQVGVTRSLLEKTLNVSSKAKLPKYHSDTLRKRMSRSVKVDTEVKAGKKTTGKVAIFTTCYGNYNEPDMGEDLIAVLRHNGIQVTLVGKEQCCGMPKLELGDLESVAKAKEANAPQLSKLIDEGWDIIAPIPSCVLMFKQELPLMFPEDAELQKIKASIFDPFEYLHLRNKDGLMNTDFKQSLGKVAYHVACHQRVQNIGMKTRDILQMVPDTEVDAIERCSGHDGTYAVKSEYHDVSMKIVRPVVSRVQKAEANYYTSDCPMAGHHIANGMDDGSDTTHPMGLLRKAYGI
jgi:Fe-S oxidoreductase